MKIIVCAKQIKFTYARTGRDPDKNFIAPEDSVFRINPWDESALESALELKEKSEDIEVILLTLGPVIAEKELRRWVALGVDEVCRIDSESGYDPWSKSVILSAGIKELKADLVLCGKESVDRQNGQTGAFIAYNLSFPFVSNVTRIEMAGNMMSRAVRNAGRGVREGIECPLPAVFSISRTGIEARLPLYEGKQRASLAPFRILEIDRDTAEKKLISKGIYPPRPRPKPVSTPDSKLNAFDRINQLLAGSHIEKKGRTLTGDTDSLVEGIISYLKENGFLEKNNPSKK